MTAKKDLPIGMFDSGIGGLTIMQQMIKRLPQEQIIYFGDTARVPYGAKGPDTIIRYSLENTSFLMQQGIKILVVACSTASSCAMSEMKAAADIPVIGMIEPGVNKAAQVTKNGRIAVLATRTTINRGMYQQEITRQLPEAKIFPIACPLFVPIVEEGFVDHAASNLIVQEYLKPLEKEGVDTVLLGCTHYPMLKNAIQRVLGTHVQVVDSGETCAEAVQNVLCSQNLKRDLSSPKHQYFVSEDPASFKQRGEAFLGKQIDLVRCV